MKIFASDFDHTLFHRERNPHVSQEDLEAIQAFQGEGNRFGMCTGRPYQGLHLDLPEELHPDFYILSSGACIMDGEGKVLFQKAIPYDVVEQILAVFGKWSTACGWCISTIATEHHDVRTISGNRWHSANRRCT